MLDIDFQRLKIPMTLFTESEMFVLLLTNSSVRQYILR